MSGFRLHYITVLFAVFTFSEFLQDIQNQKKPAAGLRDAFAALEIVNQIYKDSGYDYSA